MKVNLDFETFSECDLRAHGAWVYSRHPSTRVLCASYSEDGGAPELLFKEAKIKSAVHKMLEQADEIHAANSFFECCIIANVLGFADSIDFTQWHDTLALASASAWPQSLGMITSAMPFEEEFRKQAEGKKLIQQLCKMQKVKDELISPQEKWGDEYLPLLQKLGEYCVQDVVAEQEVGNRLRPLSDTERQVWIVDQQLNWRGMKCDVSLARKCYSLYLEEKERQLSIIKGITGVSNPNSRAQILKWVNENGLELENLQSATLAEELEKGIKDHNVRAVVKYRSTSSRTPPTKFKAMLARADRKDHRIRDMISYHGANTGRWASRGVNTQNLPRPIFKGFELPTSLVLEDRTDELELYYGDKIASVCSLIRPALIASTGNKLVVVDYSSIEARCLAWLGDQPELLEVFRTHGKVYEHAASQIYHKPIDDINKDERFVGKTASLALGYQGGYKAFLRMAKNYGVDIPEVLAKNTVEKWRKANPNIVRFWYACGEAAMNAVNNPGRAFKLGKGIMFKAGKYKGMNYLWCRLPSGRVLSYVNPKIREGDYGPKVTFHGINSFTRQWGVNDTYGGKLVENITQAVARDLLAEAKLRLQGTVYENIVLSVHDEIISDVPENQGSVDEMSEIMCRLPEWAIGLPVNAEGEETHRYWK